MTLIGERTELVSDLERFGGRETTVPFLYLACRLATSSQKTHCDGFLYASGAACNRFAALVRSTNERNVGQAPRPARRVPGAEHHVGGKVAFPRGNLSPPTQARADPQAIFKAAISGFPARRRRNDAIAIR
jgi:hypothetical protein